MEVCAGRWICALNPAAEVVGFKPISMFSIIDYEIMDYAIDSYFTGDDVPNNENNEPRTDFVYEDRRSFSKVYIFCKYIGLIFYMNTLLPCNKLLLNAMMGLMCLSTMNSARYEFAHYRKYGYRFSSMAEFDAWKGQQYSKSRLVFSFGELGLKIGYGITTFPPQFDFSFQTKCGMGESILNVHMLVLFMVYIVACVLSIYLIYHGCCFDFTYNHTHPANRLRNHVRVDDQDRVSRVRPLDAVAVAVSVPSNEECCICLDKDIDNVRPWVGLPCGHSFHAACISQWGATQHMTCPVCRFDVRITNN